MKTLLSIDLDYWTNCYKHYNLNGATFIHMMFQHLPKVWVIDNHHKILDLIPKGTERIVNIDYHNDILGESAFDDYYNKNDDLNEGTWGNFLPKSVERFEWFYPQHKKCVTEKGGLCCDENGKVWYDYPLEYYQKLHFASCDFTGVDSMVICISPEWASLSSPDSYLQTIYVDPIQDFSNPVKIKG